MSGVAHAALVVGLVLITLGYGWLQWRARDRVAAEVDTDESARWFEAVRKQPEPSWATPVDLPRQRLRTVPVAPSLRLVPPPADDSWLEELLAEDPLQIPSQRKPGSAS